MELETNLIIAQKLNYLKSEDQGLIQAQDQINEIGRMINGLIKTPKIRLHSRNSNH